MGRRGRETETERGERRLWRMDDKDDDEVERLFIRLCGDEL